VRPAPRSQVRRRTLLPGEATGNRRESSSWSHGTALKMPPASL